jgi:hypothetical protein
VLKHGYGTKFRAFEETSVPGNFVILTFILVKDNLEDGLDFLRKKDILR